MKKLGVNKVQKYMEMKGISIFLMQILENIITVALDNSKLLNSGICLQLLALLLGGD